MQRKDTYMRVGWMIVFTIVWFQVAAWVVPGTSRPMTVVDNSSAAMSPNVLSTDVIVYTDGSCSGTIPDFSLQYGMFITQSISAGTMVPVGRYFIRIVSITNIFSPYYQPVSVIDSIPPSLQLTEGSHQTGAIGTCSSTINYTVTATDNCSHVPVTSITGFTYLGSFNGHKYYRSNAFVNWYEANNQSFQLGGYLVSINSEEEGIFLESFGPSWIGLNEVDIPSGPFTWINGDTTSYRKWHSASPVVNTLASGVVMNLYGDGYWVDRIADSNTFRFIVEFPDSSEPSIHLTRITGPASGTSVSPGVSTIIYQAEDLYKNKSYDTLIITVADTIAPVIQCETLINGLVDSDECSSELNITNPILTDNCGIASLSWQMTGATVANSGMEDIDYVDDFEFNLGTTNIYYTVTDLHGNTSTCTSQVVIADIIEPTIACPESITENLPFNSCTKYLSLPLPVVEDNCAVTSLTWQMTGAAVGVSGSTGINYLNEYTFPKGVTTISYTAKDANGNFAICSFQVTVNDITAPTLLCPSNINATTSSESCEKTLTIPNPNVTDNCAVTQLTWNMTGATVDSSASSGINTINSYTFNAGTTWVQYTATDGVHTSVCSFSVTLVDTQLPQIVCPSNIVMNTSVGQCGRNVIVTPPTATDNCGIQYITHTSTNGVNANDASGFYPVGVHTFNWTAMDYNGNGIVCPQTITIMDNESPTLVCPDSVLVVTGSTGCSAYALIDAPIVSDNCSVASITNNSPYQTSSSDASGVYPVGVTWITWTATDVNNRTRTCDSKVTVVDITPPVIICGDDYSVVANAQDTTVTIHLTNPIVTDNCTVSPVIWNSITGNEQTIITIPMGETLVEWFAMDESGNTSSCQLTITAIENDIPVIACDSSLIYYSAMGLCGVEVDLEVPSATDSNGIQGEVTNNYSITLDNVYFGIGMHHITWSATDTQGNVGYCTTKLTVLDTISPNILCADTLFGNSQPGYQYGVIELEFPGVQEACNFTLDNEFNALPGAPTAFEVGITPLIWTAIDSSGNIGYCITHIVIADSIPPIILCADSIILAAETGMCSAWVEVSQPIISDNESNITWLNSINGTSNPSGYFDRGTHELTWYAKDVNGNMDSCTQIIQIVDTQAPIILCDTSIVVYTSANVCGAQVVIPTPTVMDNCDTLLTVINSWNNSAEFNFFASLGDTSFTWIAIDQSMNSGYCHFTITVIDTLGYAFNCPDSDSLIIEPNHTVNIPNYISELPPIDECGLDIQYMQSPPAGTPIDTSTTITITAIDGKGNISDCSFNLILITYELPEIMHCPDTSVTVYIDSNCLAVCPDFRSFITSEMVNVQGDYTIHQSPEVGQPITINEPFTLWIEDQAGYSSNICTLSFVIIDTIAPVFIPLNTDHYLFTCDSEYSWIPQVNDCSDSVSIVLEQGSYPLQVGLNEFTYSANDGHNTAYYHFIIELGEMPTIVWTPLETFYCANEEPIELEVETLADYSFEINGNALIQPLLDPSTFTPGVYTIQLLASHFGCTATLQQTFEIRSIPTISIDQQVWQTCDGTIAIQSTSNSDSALWTCDSNALTILDPNSLNTQVMSDSFGEYTLYVTFSLDGCTSHDSTQLIFHQQPLPPNAGLDQTLHLAQEAYLTGTYDGSGNTSWSVHFGSGSFEFEHELNTRVTNFDMGLNQYVLTVTNAICTASDTVNVWVNGLFIPTGFSPNDDGVNDYFEIRGVENLAHAELFIYNRWGQYVYHSERYRNEWYGGNTQNEQLPDDTYFFELILRNEKHTGYVVIKR